MEDERSMQDDRNKAARTGTLDLESTVMGGADLLQFELPSGPRSPIYGVEGFVRRNPAMALLAALAVGAILARAFRD